MKKLITILSLVVSFSFLSGCSNAFIGKQDIKNGIKICEEKSTKLEDKAELVYDKEKTVCDDTSKVSEEIVINEEFENEGDVQKTEKVEEEVLQKGVDAEEVTDVEVDISNYTKKILLSSGKTAFNPNQTNRSSNLRLAASLIDGLLLNPGEEFSFNTVVGRRTAERGFLPADVFSGNSVVKGIGGGICQTSTTLCIAVKQTTMEILEQNPHSMRVTYASYEDEAMINYGTSDFRFRNTYDFPIVIEMHFEQNSEKEIIICDIYALE